MATYRQRKAVLGDFTVFQDDKESEGKTVITNDLDESNNLELLDWSIADFKGGGDAPYLYVPNRVYVMDTVILKDTLEGLMPIPENVDGNCSFETVSTETVILEHKPGKYGCSANCPKYYPPPSSCTHYSQTDRYDSPKCPFYPNGVFEPFGIGIRGMRMNIDFVIKASSAFEYLDIRVNAWKPTTTIQTISVKETDLIGWPTGESPGELFRYKELGNNVLRIFGWPGGGNNGKWGPAGTEQKVRVSFTLLGDYIDQDLVWYGDFPETKRTVAVSYVCAGRRGNLPST